MLKKGVQVLGSKILILGFTFKENCPDIRNTKVIDIYRNLKEYNSNVSIYDPWANREFVNFEYGVDMICELRGERYDTVILAVGHNKFKELKIKNLLKENHVLFDIKGVLPKEIVDYRL